MSATALITIKNCSVQDGGRVCLPRIDWRMATGEAWLFIGPNGGGKADFVHALAGKRAIVPNESPSAEDSFYESAFIGSTAVVSLEEAAALIAEERERDESDILEKEDEGRTARQYISEVLGGSSKRGAPLPAIASRLETLPQVKLCGVEQILDRGLRYLSTGEIRRTLLCRALLSGCKLLILSDPFAGLDVESRAILLEFFDTLLQKQLVAHEVAATFPRIILSMERFQEIPAGITRVLELTERSVSFSGTRQEYESFVQGRLREREARKARERQDFLQALAAARADSDMLMQDCNAQPVPDSLIRFEDVTVGWGERRVLRSLTWEVKKNEHWLIRGPNGSGKTTILELITGDNMQVFRERITLFGRRRGSGETIWDIKRQLGIVSYRLHVEYRMVGGTSLKDVIISGFHDSIGLYVQATDFENAVARTWLRLAGFAGRERLPFSALSYGEQRAVLILRAAVKSPRVLILDEPCHGLDEEYRAIILDLLETIAATGTTTLLHVTHDVTEVLPCEKHILELHPTEDPMYNIIVET